MYVYLFLNCRPFKPLLNTNMVDFGGIFLKLGSKNNRNCPHLSALSIHHDTPRLHQQAFLPPMARTHANALSTEVTQNRMAQRYHLSKALVVSLMKNHYSNKSFCRGKGRPIDLEFFHQITGRYRGSYFSMDGFLIAEIGCRCRCRLVSQACLPS